MNIRPCRRHWRGPRRDPRVAERFELYVCGVELANGFGELTDAAEQRRRLEREMAEKERIYGERYPIDEDFLAALAQMPQASGIALGLDRLVMPSGENTRAQTQSEWPSSVCIAAPVAGSEIADGIVSRPRGKEPAIWRKHYSENRTRMAL